MSLTVMLKTVIAEESLHLRGQGQGIGPETKAKAVKFSLETLWGQGPAWPRRPHHWYELTVSDRDKTQADLAERWHWPTLHYHVHSIRPPTCRLLHCQVPRHRPTEAYQSATRASTSEITFNSSTTCCNKSAPLINLAVIQVCLQ